MQTLRIVLVLISIGCIVGPIGTVVIMYRNNLSQMVITPQIQQLLPSNNNSNNNGNNNNNNSNNNNFPSGNNNSGNNNNNGNNNSNNNSGNNGNNSNNNNNSGGVSPVYVSGQINTIQKTITLTFSVNNGLNHDTLVNSMSGTLEITANQYTLGTVSSSSPVTILSGQTGIVTVSGTLTQNGLNYLNDHYSHIDSLDVTVVNGQMTEDGITNQGAQSQDIGNIAITW